MPAMLTRSFMLKLAARRRSLLRGMCAPSLHCLQWGLMLLCGWRRFPTKERMGKVAVSITQLPHGYQDRALFNDVNLEIERNERVAFIGGFYQKCAVRKGATITCGCGLWGAHWPTGCGGVNRTSAVACLLAIRGLTSVPYL